MARLRSKHSICVTLCELCLFPSLSLLYNNRQKDPVESNVEYENNNPPVTHSEDDEDDTKNSEASKPGQQDTEDKSQNNAPDGISQTDVHYKINHLFDALMYINKPGTLQPIRGDNQHSIKEQLISVDLSTKKNVESRSRKAFDCFLAVIRSKEGQVILQKLQQSRSHDGHTLSSQGEAELQHQLWKLFYERLVESEYETAAFLSSLPEDAVPGPYEKASPVPGVPLVVMNYMFTQTSSDRGRKSLASAIFSKIQARPSLKPKQAPSIVKHPAHTTAAEPRASLVSIKTCPELAISPETMAKLKAGAKYYSGFHHNQKTSTESLSSQQATLLSELHVHAAMEASSSSGLPEAPCGRQVPKDPQGKRQSKKSSYEGKQSHEGTSSGTLSSGSSGVGGGSDAGGDGGGDRDPPKRTSRRDDVEPDRKEEEEEEEEEDRGDSTGSDSEDEPRPKPQQGKNEHEFSGAFSAETQQEMKRNDSGMNVQPPVPTNHSDLAMDTNLQIPQSSTYVVGSLQATPAQNLSGQHNSSTTNEAILPGQILSHTPLHMFNWNASPQISPQASLSSSPISPHLYTSSPSLSDTPSALTPHSQTSSPSLSDTSSALTPHSPTSSASLPNVLDGLEESQSPHSSQPILQHLAQPPPPQPHTYVEYSSSPNPTSHSDRLIPFPGLAGDI